ncbi:lipocalin family protein [Orrella sp. JC864]|uniref:lipocalin family protein n=1 Tax=Orrella sp. JC864 TaxID=3120298 RepID=UPI003007FB29
MRGGDDADLRASAQEAAASTVRTVPSVDLQRYGGMWYEIANYPMVFQRNCVGDTTAHYMPRKDGSIEVLNRCRNKKGGIDEADGQASVVPGSGNAKLEISFFWPFKGDYWIIGLDPDYRWAVVGSPTRKYLWILSRTPSLPEGELKKALDAARAQGYDLKALRYTAQSKAKE